MALQATASEAAVSEAAASEAAEVVKVNMGETLQANAHTGQPKDRNCMTTSCASDAAAKATRPRAAATSL